METKIKTEHKYLRESLNEIYRKERESDYREIREALEKIIRFDEKFDNSYITFSFESLDKISYGKNDETVFDVDKRIKTTFARFVRKFLEIDCNIIPDHILQKISNELIEINLLRNDLEKNIDSVFKILRGNDLMEAYENRIGSSSCMTGCDAEKVLLYAENPEKVGLLVKDREFRALLWNTDQDQMVLDRIYSGSTLAINLATHYCVKNNILQKGNLDEQYTVTLKRPSIDIWPYMDTFQYLKHTDKNVICSNECARGFSDNARNTDGTTDDYGENTRECECCGNRLSEDNTYWHNDEAYCESCFYDHFFVCEGCNETHPNDDAISAGDNLYCSESCFYDHFFVCEGCNETHSNDDAISAGDNLYCSESCANRDGYYECDQCNEWHSQDETYTFDGKTYCQDCYSEHVTTCEECDEEIYREDSKEFNGKTYCQDCYDEQVTTCKECDEKIYIEDSKEFNGKTYCQDCYDEQVTTCKECDEKIYNENQMETLLKSEV